MHVKWRPFFCITTRSNSRINHIHNVLSSSCSHNVFMQIFLLSQYVGHRAYSSSHCDIAILLFSQMYSRIIRLPSIPEIILDLWVMSMISRESYSNIVKCCHVSYLTLSYGISPLGFWPVIITDVYTITSHSINKWFEQ